MLYVSLVVGLAVAALSIALLDPFALEPPFEGGWAMFILMGGTTIAAQSVIVGSRDVGLSVGTLFAIGLLFGPAASGIVGGLSVAASEAITRAVWYRAAFNVASASVAAIAGSVIFHSLANPITGQDVESQIGPAAAAIVASYVLNVGSIVGAVSLSTGSRPLSIWSDKYRPLLLPYMAFGSAGLAMTVSYSVLGLIGAAIFLFPLIMLQIARLQLARQISTSVERLRDAYETPTASFAPAKSASAR